MAQVVQGLPSKHEALNSNTSTIKKLHLISKNNESVEGKVKYIGKNEMRKKIMDIIHYNHKNDQKLGQTVLQAAIHMPSGERLEK
jgi:hypothetical protein